MRFLRSIRRAVLLVLVVLTGCFVRDIRWERIRPANREEAQLVTLVTTGYCPCGKCCGWQRNWFGRPVISGGPSRGKPKKVGYTASGVRARPGTIAADTRLYPFGTVMYVPGYGYGRVEDRGSDIQGHHIDLYFRTHWAAKRWGRGKQRVKVWLP
jgi:3D (Asp-Asp-Asp) domain-containing protein